MKKLWFLMFSLGMLVFVACDKDDDDHTHDDATTDYEAHIHSPDAEDKKVDDMIHLHVEFHEHDGGKVHHVNVKIYEKDNPDNVIYDAPSDAHVHADGTHEHHADFMLNADNGVEGHTDWVIEAKVWGHEAGEHEKVATKEFHVHPN